MEKKMNKSEIKQMLEDIDQIKKFRKTLKRWTDIAYENDERGYLVTLKEIDQRLDHIQEDLEQTNNQDFLNAFLIYTAQEEMAEKLELRLRDTYECDEDGEESFFCGQCGDEIDQITYINGDVCYSCEEGE